VVPHEMDNGEVLRGKVVMAENLEKGGESLQINDNQRLRETRFSEWVYN
jgi:hypothetical protein